MVLSINYPPTSWKEVDEAEINTTNNQNNKHTHFHETNHVIRKFRGHHLYQDALNRRQRLEEKLKQETNDNNDDQQTRTPTKAATREELERLAHRRYMKAEEYKTRLEEKRLNKIREELRLERSEEEKTMDVVVRIPSTTFSMRRRLHTNGSVDHSPSSYKEEEEERDDEEETEVNTANSRNKNNIKHVHVETNHVIRKNRGHHLYQDALNRRQRLEEKLKQETNDDNDSQTQNPTKAATREELERLAHRRYMKAEEYKKRLEEKRLNNKMKSEQQEQEMDETKKSITSQGKFYHFDYASVDTKRYERHRNITTTISSSSDSRYGSRCGSVVSSLSTRTQGSERLARLSEQGRLKLLARNNIHNRRVESSSRTERIFQY